jgi:uncharacterized protein YceK
MGRQAARGLAAVLAFALGGCGTMNNLRPPEKADKEAPAPVPQAVYGGVGLDAQVGAKWLAAPFVAERLPQVSLLESAVDGTCKVGIGAYVLAIDLPLSAVADTLTLPVTIPAALKKQAPSGLRAGAGRQKDPEDGYDVDAPDDPPAR